MGGQASDPRTALAAAMSATRAHRDGRYLGWGEEPLFAPPEHGVLVLGPPRSGKTSAIVTPNVLGADGPAMVVSTKRDVFDATARARALAGRVTVFDPSGSVRLPEGTIRVGWSPITSAHSWDRAVLNADAMVGARRPSGDQMHWNERAAALIAPLLHAASLGGRSMRDVVGAINRREIGEFVEVLTRAGEGVALDVAVGILETDERERSGIFSTASSVLAAYRTHAALENAALPPIDFDDFLSGRDTCYVLGSGEHQRHLAPIIAGSVGDLRSTAYARAAIGGARPALLVLDELANIAPLDDLPALVAEGASQGVVTLACLQDLSQARRRWGEAAEGFLSLFGTKVVLPGIGDRRTLEALALLAGERDVTTRTVSGPGRHSRRSWSRATRREPVLTPSEIANGPAGTAIVVLGARVGRITLTGAHTAAPFDTCVAYSLGVAQRERAQALRGRAVRRERSGRTR
jgi:type IV secretory pathway TraG/TraD family ATPase VirD4